MANPLYGSNAYDNAANIVATHIGLGACDATFSIGAESAGTEIIVSIQLLDAFGNNVQRKQYVKVLLLNDANGDALASEDYAISYGSDGYAVEGAANVADCLCEADGDIDLKLTITGAATCYVAVVCEGGKLAISDLVTHE
jgi:hypothetical protein